jgi:hypothetical protein
MSGLQETTPPAAEASRKLLRAARRQEPRLASSSSASTPPPSSAARQTTPPRRRGLKKLDLNFYELLVDKSLDFVLIFVGLYAATSVQRCQDVETEREEYVTLLKDFRTELSANLAEEASIAKDLGPITESTPGKNLGPMQVPFDEFFAALAEDEKVVHCLHVEFAAGVKPGSHAMPAEEKAACHTLYEKFEKDHNAADTHASSFSFKPAVLTPFYRYEVWQLYIAGGVRLFRNKDLAVKIGEIYNNARLVEKQVAEIETIYNDSFMKQVGRSSATDQELAEIIHDEEQEHGLSPQDQTMLIHINEALKEEHAATIEAQSILTLKVERMKNTVSLMHKEIEAVQAAIDEELKVVDH